jgi:predicted transcriptional regulator
LKQGDLENLILNALWFLEACEPPMPHISVQHIQHHINQHASRDWAYTTVKTVLDRLVDKGWLRRNKLGKKFTYASQLKQNSAGEQALSKLLQQYFNNSPALLRETLDALERNQKTNGMLGKLPNAESTSSTSGDFGSVEVKQPPSAQAKLGSAQTSSAVKQTGLAAEATVQTDSL